MASSRNFINPHEEEGSSSSTRSPNEPRLSNNDERDELDYLFDGDDGDVLGNDPLNDELAEPMSFKRKQKQSIFSRSSRLLSTLTGNRLGSASPRSPHSGTETPTRLEDLNPERPDNTSNTPNGQKEGAPLDWYVEGPGRRVGYEDLTAIDWIFEYTKERQRLRVLYSSATGIVGYIRQLLDSSQTWVILVLTGLAVGGLAAAIDVASDWLGDIKTGYCTSGPEGGAFYLNKQFCCYGYDQGAKCLGWKPWAAALGIGSTGGKWFIEYFFFIIFSVSSSSSIPKHKYLTNAFIGDICLMCWVPG